MVLGILGTVLCCVFAGVPAIILGNVARKEIDASQVDHVGISFNPRANLARRLWFVALNRPSMRSLLDRLRRQGSGERSSPDAVRASAARHPEQRRT